VKLLTKQKRGQNTRTISTYRGTKKCWGGVQTVELHNHIIDNIFIYYYYYYYYYLLYYLLLLKHTITPPIGYVTRRL